MKWDELTADFNHQFAGQVQKRGEKPRPVRSKSSLITERYRIPEVCEIAGLKPKVEKKTEEAKSEDDEDRTSDKSKADKGKDPSKRGGRGGRGSRGGRRG